MKIKLSKSQWQFIGKQTGWIKSAHQWIIPDEHSKILKHIFEMLPGQLHQTDRITTFSKELAFDDVAGQAYISISFNSDKNAMHVEKYYDSEFLQNEMGEVIYITINWEKPQDVIHNVNNTITKWMGGIPS